VRAAGFSVLACGLALALSACATYAPAPPKREAFPAVYDARRLDPKPAGVAWSGVDLLSAALTRNPQIIEARAKYVAALAAARAAKAAQGPSLTLTAEYANEAPHWGYSGSSDIPLDYGARRGTRITTANLQALQAFYDYGETIWSVRTDLEKARIEIVSAISERQAAEQAGQVRRERLDRVDRRIAAGQDARAVGLAALVDVAAIERRGLAAHGRELAGRAALAVALGVSPGAVRDLAVAPIPRPPTGEDLSAWRRDAALSRRDVLKAVADYDIAESALRLEIANQYPQVSLGPGYNYDHGVTKLPFSLSLALPPWDLNRGAIAKAEADRAAAGRSLEAAQAGALAAVDTASDALATARRDLLKARDGALPVARKIDADLLRSTSAGETDRVDELAARGAMMDATLDALDAEHAQALAQADLEDALRRSFDSAETAVIEKALKEVGGVR
jgi:CRISPR system Cascade subunit CasA